MDELAKRFGELAEKYGPNVVDAALQAARVEAYSKIVGSLAGITAMVIGLLIAWYLWNKELEDEHDEIPLRIFGGIAGIISAIGLVICVSNLLDPWIWTAIQHPELWIAKKVFKL